MAVSDAWSTATLMSGTTGAGTGDFNGATQETGEPAVDASAVSTVGTEWLTYEPLSPGLLSFSVDSGPVASVVEIWVGWDLQSLALQDITVGTGSSVTTVDAGLGANIVVYVRVYPTTVQSASAPFTYTWTFTPQVNVLSVTLLADCFRSPGYVYVHVGNLVPNDTVNFYIDNSSTTSLTETVPYDEVGITVGTVYYVPHEEQLLFVAVPVAENYAQGTHTLTISGAASGQSIVDFTVLSDSLSPLVGDTPNDALAGLPVTTHWIFFDPVPNGETYIFDTNPLTLTSPYAEKTITTEQTTAPDGQVMEWQGNAKAPTWTITGTFWLQSQLEALERFAALDHRVWIVDNVRRAWVVSVEEFSPSPRQRWGSSYVHNWTMTLIVWDGPVQL